MRFNEIIHNQLEIDDDVIEDYITCFGEDFDIKNCTIDDFIEFVTTNYYVEDFVELTDSEYDLKKKYFIDEVNRVKAQMKND
jgi:hypothetical protein